MTTAIKLNGEAHHLSKPISLQDLVDNLGYANKRIAIELNGQIIPRSEYPQTILAANDSLEIITAVGGG